MNHAHIRILMEAAHRSGKDQQGSSCMTENLEFHLAPKRLAVPLMILIQHNGCLSSFYCGYVAGGLFAIEEPVPCEREKGKPILNHGLSGLTDFTENTQHPTPYALTP